MFTKRSMIFAVISLSIVLLSCLIGGVVELTKYHQAHACYNDRPPLKTLNVTINTSRSQEFLQKLLEFSDKNNFKNEVSYYSPNGENFSIWMERNDLEIVTRSPFTRGEFKIGFYNNDCTNPTITSDIENLVSQLKRLLEDIPSIQIEEEQQ